MHNQARFRRVEASVKHSTGHAVAAAPGERRAKRRNDCTWVLTKGA